MAEAPDPSSSVKQAVLTCPQCGAPLPLPGVDGFVTCAFCGVRTEFSQLIIPPRVPSSPEPEVIPFEPPPGSVEDDTSWGHGIPIVRVVVAIVAIATIIVVIATFYYAAPQPQSNTAGTPVAHCSVTINASATSGPAPFTATFTAVVATPPGVTTGDPMWQFGPFPPGFDLNFTYGSTVTHTWVTNGSFGVHVSVPDSTGQGCWTSMIVNVTSAGALAELRVSASGTPFESSAELSVVPVSESRVQQLPRLSWSGDPPHLRTN